LGKRYGVHPVRVGQWKKHLLGICPVKVVPGHWNDDAADDE